MLFHQLFIKFTNIIYQRNKPPGIIHKTSILRFTPQTWGIFNLIKYFWLVLMPAADELGAGIIIIIINWWSPLLLGLELL